MTLILRAYPSESENPSCLRTCNAPRGFRMGSVGKIATFLGNQMLNKLPWMLLALFVFAGTLTFTGCEKKGPLEELGEEIDDEIDDATDER